MSRVFSVHIPFIISLVRPVHTFMEKKYIIGNTSQIAANYLKKRVIKETTRKRMVSLHL